jgi:hypothetical protein
LPTSVASIPRAKQVEIDRGAADEPALGATDIDHVSHVIVAQYFGDRPPSLVGVADIGKTLAPDFNRLVRPAPRLRHVERSFDQSERETPANRLRKTFLTRLPTDRRRRRSG